MERIRSMYGLLNAHSTTMCRYMDKLDTQFFRCDESSPSAMTPPLSGTLERILYSERTGMCNLIGDMKTKILKGCPNPDDSS